MKTTGIIILLVGLALSIFTTIKFFTKEKVVDLGVIEVTQNKPHEITWSPIIGILVMGVGGLFLLQATRKK